jgi:hypothetical protein
MGFWARTGRYDDTGKPVSRALLLAPAHLTGLPEAIHYVIAGVIFAGFTHQPAEELADPRSDGSGRLRHDGWCSGSATRPRQRDLL